MKTHTYNLVLDIGTSGIKAVVFDDKNNIIALADRKLAKRKPKIGHVEQNPTDYLKISKVVLREAIKKSKKSPKYFKGFGITNQRETTILWNTKKAKPVYPAIVWEDKRTKMYCRQLNKHKKFVEQKTGLQIDSYFSASKIHWILQNIPRTKVLLEKNQLAFGTVDSWVMWNFLEKFPHVTDSTNASRTLLFNVHKLLWDEKLLEIFKIPSSILPHVQPSSSKFGVVKKEIFGFTLPCLAVCGDQQSSMFAAGHERGVTKVTYGTGTFVSQFLGSQFKVHKPFFIMLTPSKHKPHFAAEGKIEASAEKVSQVLGHPEKLRKVVVRICRKVDAHIKKLPLKPKRIIVDGGITRYPPLIDIQMRISKIPVVRQKTFQGTALGIVKLISQK